MDNEKNIYETPEQKVGVEPGSSSDSAQSILEHSSEVYEQAEQAVIDVYDKTAQSAREVYKQTNSYSDKNPGKIILISLVIGVGLVVLLLASSRLSYTGRFVQPVVNALSGIAREIVRISALLTEKAMQKIR
jgi:ElaB/YqjD/DUF883 family membrane-anchored ribosome-binding protein